MALTISNQSNLDSLGRLAILDRSKFRSFFHVIAQAKSPQNTIETVDDPTLSLSRATFNPVKFLLDLGVKLSGRMYRILKHDPNTFYVAISGFNLRKFDVIYDQASVGFPDHMQSLSSNDYLTAGNGPFFHNISENILGPAFDNGSHILIEENSSSSSRAIQWNASNVGTPPLHLEIRENPATGANNSDGFSSLVRIISNKIKNPEGYYQLAVNVSDSYHVFAYNRTIDLVIDIVFNGQAKFDIETIVDALVELEFDDAVFFDGGSSVTLYEYAGPGGKGRLIIEPSSFKSFINVYYAIKKSS